MCVIVGKLAREPNLEGRTIIGEVVDLLTYFPEQTQEMGFRRLVCGERQRNKAEIHCHVGAWSSDGQRRVSVQV